MWLWLLYPNYFILVVINFQQQKKIQRATYVFFNVQDYN